MGEVEQNLPTLAGRINEEHRACEVAVGAALTHAMNAGELLVEVKASLPHGAFGPWLAENFTGSDRTARAYMRVYSRRDELGAKRQSSATLSLDGALKALSVPKEESPHAETARKPATFEDGVATTKRFVEIRDSGAWKRSGHASFEEYLRVRWGERGITPENLRAWEAVAKDPPRSLRGAPIDKITELAQRLKELESLPAKKPAPHVAGRALREIEEKELYKLAGYETFTRYCSERLRLTRKWREVLFLEAELADVVPAFHESEFPWEFPEDMPREDFERAWKILNEILELVGASEEE